MWIDKKRFRERVTSRELKISVVGLGYVGLSIACLFAKAGFQVYAFDTDEEKIKKLRRGANYIPQEKWLTPIIAELIDSKLMVSTDVTKASNTSDFIVVAVTTHSTRGKPDYTYLTTAARSIAQCLSVGKLISFESTTEPETTDNLLKPVLERVSGLRAGKDFGLVFSPERIDPGNERQMLWNIPKIVGGIDFLSTELASFIYSQVVEKVVPVSSPTTAELVKVIENTQRDVNIALTNLFAKVADKLGIDIEEALDAAATKWNFMRLKPGCGVGGKCIGDVAYMAINLMERHEVDPGLVRESRKLNESMPRYTIDKIVTALKSAGKDIRDAKIAILGLAYKGGTSDTKGSPALIIINELKRLGVSQMVVYDPFIRCYDGVPCAGSLNDALNSYDCVVIATDHPQFKDLVFDQHAITIDGRNCLLRKAKQYYGVGR